MIKNIVIVNDFNYIQGGASKVAIDTAKLLKEEGYNIYFFSAVNKKEAEIEGIKYITTNQKEALNERNKLKGVVNGIYNIKAKKEFKQLLTNIDKKETIIHIHGWTKALSCSIFDIAFKMNYKVILTLHDYFTACPNGGYFNYPKSEICHYKPLSWKCIKCNCDSRNYAFKIYRLIRQFVQNKIVKLNDKLENVITISDLSEEILKETLNKKTKTTRINNPIDFDDKTEIIDFTKNKYYLYVGRISKEKGVDIFCKAITESGYKGIVVGDGPEKENLEREYSNIEFVGWKEEKEVDEYIKKAYAMIFTTRLYEGAPLTPLDAMKYGIPCLISDCSSAVDYVLKIKDILVFNEEGLTEKIQNISKNEEQIKEYLNSEEFKSKMNSEIEYLNKYKKLIGEI